MLFGPATDNYMVYNQINQSMFVLLKKNRCNTLVVGI